MLMYVDYFKEREREREREREVEGISDLLLAITKECLMIRLSP